jgi:hypothetical protein
MRDLLGSLFTTFERYFINDQARLVCVSASKQWSRRKVTVVTVDGSRERPFIVDGRIHVPRQFPEGDWHPGRTWRLYDHLAGKTVPKEIKVPSSWLRKPMPTGVFESE